MLLCAIKVVFQPKMLVIELGVEGKVIQEIYFLRIVLQFYLSHQRIRIYCRLHLLREVLILVVIHKDTGFFLVLVVQVITSIAQLRVSVRLSFSLKRELKAPSPDLLSTYRFKDTLGISCAERLIPSHVNDEKTETWSSPKDCDVL